MGAQGSVVSGGLPCVLGVVALIRIFPELAAHVILSRSETRRAADLGSVEPG